MPYPAARRSAQNRLLDGQGVAGGHMVFVEQGPSDPAVLGDAVVALKSAGDADFDGAVLSVGDDVDAAHAARSKP
ncbi:hypothetical protein [Streptomyces sp. NPDC006334]|uniref:hypothetical protein n=1 Tax=Streptomyces sp. NPDC006334 TaxID=3156754 RepID=UPI0033ADBDB9